MTEQEKPSQIVTVRGYDYHGDPEIHSAIVTLEDNLVPTSMTASLCCGSQQQNKELMLNNKSGYVVVFANQGPFGYDGIKGVSFDEITDEALRQGLLAKRAVTLDKQAAVENNKLNALSEKKPFYSLKEVQGIRRKRLVDSVKSKLTPDEIKVFAEEVRNGKK